MRVTSLLSFIIAGIGLFFFGFTLAALVYEPAIEVLGVVVQFLLVFVGLLGIDEWHRQFKFKRKWERLEKRLQDLAEVESSISHIKESLIIIEGFTISREHLSFKELLEPILDSIINNSRKIIDSLNHFGITNYGSPSLKELNQLERYTKIERRFLRDLSDKSPDRSFFSVVQHDNEGRLFAPQGTLVHQNKLVNLINEYGNYEWGLSNRIKEEILRAQKALEKMEK